MPRCPPPNAGEGACTMEVGTLFRERLAGLLGSGPSARWAAGRRQQPSFSVAGNHITALGCCQEGTLAIFFGKCRPGLG